MKKRTIVGVATAALAAGMAIATLVPAVAATSAASLATTSTPAPPGPRAGGGPGGQGHGPGEMFGGGLVEVVAKLTGETTTTVASAVKSGKSLAAIAKAKSVSVDDVVALALHAPKAYLDSEVADGLVTKAAAADDLTALTKRLTEMVNSAPGTGPPGGPGMGGPGMMAPPGRPTTGTPPARPSGTTTSAVQ